MERRLCIWYPGSLAICYQSAVLIDGAADDNKINELRVGHGANGAIPKEGCNRAV